MTLAKVRHRKAEGMTGARVPGAAAAYSYDAMTDGLVRAARSVITHSVGLCGTTIDSTRQDLGVAGPGD
jgi:hypothetical protein